MANLFIQSLADNWSLFPSTLRWVVQTMWQLLKKAKINHKDINNILTDMVFTNFICPAVVSPDLFGISDAPISENARSNLIQIGQILQVLAIIKHEEIDGKFSEIVEMFNGHGNVITDLMEQLMENEYDISVSMMAVPHQNDFGRNHVLVTQNELNIFVDFLRSVLDNDGLIISGEDRRKLGKILDQLPDKWETMLSADQISSAAATVSSETTNKTKQSLINLGKSTKNKLAKTMSLSMVTTNTSNGETDDAACYLSANGTNGLIACSNNNNVPDSGSEQVLVFPINISEDSKFQLLSEQDVLNMNNVSNEIEAPLVDKAIADLDKDIATFDETAAAVLQSRKHTRFSLSNDDQSIGNTSDNLEVVSEAQSNHSVTSSLEMEENDQNLLNDNLSDMVSANVSGRGSPNISGRDTPSSQVTEGDQPQIPAPQMAKILKKARSDIEDKFCKFEIKKLVEGDETISIMSDTWSTDVLASDSETIEPNDAERNFSTPLIPNAVVLPGDNNFDPLRRTGQLHGAFMETDTRSESAWSTDVFASDSEKTAEVDTDDNQSIAAKSDTTDAGRSESDLVRDSDNSPAVNRAPDSPFFSPRITAPRFRTVPDLENFSADSIRNADTTVQQRLQSEDLARFLSPTLVNRTARESTRFTYNSYRSIDNDSYLSGTANGSGAGMRRQNSSESSISNQSLSNEDSMMLPIAPKRLTDNQKQKKNYIFGEFADDQALINNNPGRIGEVIVKTSTKLINPFSDLTERNHDEDVEHRDIPLEQRAASYDGRRNGMVTFSSSTAKLKSKSMNYENAEILPPKTNSLQICMPLSQSATDDDKNNQQDEFVLIQKTLSLNLGPSTSADARGDFTEPAAAGAAAATVAAESTKSSRYTGTIPKSISFDASADKTSTERNYFRRTDNGNNAVAGTSTARLNGNSFFSKIKQGFKNRRSNKSPRGYIDDYGIVGSTATGNLQRNGGHNSDGTIIIRPGTAGGVDTNGFVDSSEDILAKYRRKISSSSETTNSDSIGNNRKSSQSDIDQR